MGLARRDVRGTPALVNPAERFLDPQGKRSFWGGKMKSGPLVCLPNTWGVVFEEVTSPYRSLYCWIEFSDSPPQALGFGWLRWLPLSNDGQLGAAGPVLTRSRRPGFPLGWEALP